MREREFFSDFWYPSPGSETVVTVGITCRLRISRIGKVGSGCRKENEVKRISDGGVSHQQGEPLFIGVSLPPPSPLRCVGRGCCAQNFNNSRSKRRHDNRRCIEAENDCFCCQHQPHCEHPHVQKLQDDDGFETRNITTYNVSRSGE